MNPFNPQLAETVTTDRAASFAPRGDWWFEQKLDGTRMLIVVEDGKVTGWNRRGNVVSVDSPVRNVLSQIQGQLVLDGEYIDGVFWAFDVPILQLEPRSEGNWLDITKESPYEDRRLGLEVIGNILEDRTSQHLRILPTFKTLDEKLHLVKECKVHRAEGIMLKNKDAPYLPGRRSTNMLKCKFVETADCIIVEVGREGKRSLGIALLDSNSKYVDVGAVTIRERLLTELKEGDVIEVRYLYATKENKLYQPAYMRKRTDKLPLECTLDQLKYGNKTALIMKESR